MADIVMPRLSDSMEEGTILQWLKQVGDEVAVGDELVEIETDKANMAYECDVAGTLTEILAQEGETLPIGDADRAGRGSGDGTRRRPRARRGERGLRRRRPPPSGGPQLRHPRKSRAAPARRSAARRAPRRRHE